MLRIAILLIYTCITDISESYQVVNETHLTGVYQGKTLFIQNPYDSDKKGYCITSISVNDRHLNINYNLSAIKLDFDGIDMNAPVTLRIEHTESCTPVVINPDAISYHSMFSYREISVSDSTLVWKVAGERREGSYVVELYENGVWFEKDLVPSKGNFGGSTYTLPLEVDEGPNKFRIKYVFPSGDHLYSREIDFHYYLEPVEFTPHKVQDEIYLSRSAKYVIFDRGNKEVLSGVAKSIDVRSLPSGEYIIYFDDKDPGVFTKL